jgi:two-component system response regulator FixJ
MMAHAKPRILAIDDEEAVRQSLSSVLTTYNFTVVAFESALKALEMIRSDPPDVIILDVRMPDIDGLSVLKVASETAPGVPIIMLTGYGEVPVAVRAMKSGAFDFVEKPIDDVKLVDIINTAIQARSRLGSQSVAMSELTKRLASLSDRERTVAFMVADGYSSAAIAATLKISIRTVDHHRASTMAKMKATSLPQLLKLLLMAGSARLEQ